MIPFLARRRIRQHQQVAIITHSRAAEVGASKSIHGAVRVVVTAAAVPPVVSGIGPQLYHSKRRLRTRMGVAVAAGSNKGIDVFNRGPLRFLSMQTKP